MSELLDFEKDEFLRLLTDALRAGPNSAEWKEAVARLKLLRTPEADEYQLLIRAREDLESGREYRSIRAGAGFTHKVMEQIEQEKTGAPPVPAASIVAIVAAAGIVGVLIVIAVILTRQSPIDAELSRLQKTMFATTAWSADFTTSIPTDFKPFGVAPIVSPDAGGLRPADPKGAADLVGGGVYLAKALPAVDSFEVEVGVQLRDASPAADLQIFIADSSNFTGPRTISPGELVVTVRKGRIDVYLRDGTLAKTIKATAGRHMFTIKVGLKHVIVEAGGQVLYTGLHGLPAEGSRWTGIRFLTPGSADDLNDLSVASFRVIRP